MPRIERLDWAHARCFCPSKCGPAGVVRRLRTAEEHLRLWESEERDARARLSPLPPTITPRPPSGRASPPPPSSPLPPSDPEFDARATRSRSASPLPPVDHALRYAEHRTTASSRDGPDIRGEPTSSHGPAVFTAASTGYRGGSNSFAGRSPPLVDQDEAVVNQERGSEPEQEERSHSDGQAGALEHSAGGGDMVLDEDTEDPSVVEISGEDLLAPRTYASQTQLGPSRPANRGNDPPWLGDYYLLVAVLGSRYSVSIVAQDLMLQFISRVVLSSPGFQDTQCLERAKSTRRRLGITFPVVRYVLCPKPTCPAVYPPASQCEQLELVECTRAGCHTALFDKKGKPAAEYAYVPLRAWLQMLLRHDGMLDRLEEWRTRRRPPPGTVRDVYDGSRWQAEETGFLKPVEGTINLLFSLSVDWFAPFNFTRSYECGPLLLTLLNLPPELRSKQPYEHIAGITPGLKQPTFYALQKYLRPLVLELQEFDRGVQLEAWQNGQPRTITVRARLLFTGGDTPARAKVAGFMSHSSLEWPCTVCTATIETRDNVGEDVDGRERPPPRDQEQHHSASLSLAERSKTHQDGLNNETGAHYAELDQLHYWRGVRDTALDYMHAIEHGVIKRFWHELLVNAGALTRKEQAAVQRMLATLSVPDGVARPPELLGATAGGSPSADQYATVGKVLPVLLASPELWRAAIEEYSEDWETINAVMDSTNHPAPTQVTSMENWAEIKHGAMPTKPSRRAGSLQSRAGSGDEDAEVADNEEAAQSQRSDAESSAGETDRDRADSDAAPSQTEQGSQSTPQSLVGKKKKNEKKLKKPPSYVDRTMHKGWLFDCVRGLSDIVELARREELSADELDCLDSTVKGLVNSLAVIPFTTPNTHLLLHLVEMIKRFGPPRAFWTYAAERANASLTQMLKRSNAKPGEAELTLTRLWWERAVIEQLKGSAFISADMRALVTERQQLRDAHVDRQVVRPRPRDDVVLGPSCKPPKDRWKRALGQEGFQLAADTFEQLLRALGRLSEEGEVFQAWSILGPAAAAIEIANAVDFFSSASTPAGHFTAVNGRANAAIGNTYAFIRMKGAGTSNVAELRPAQIRDIFQHRRRRGGGDLVAETFATCRVFAAAEVEDWSPIRPHPAAPYLGLWQVHAGSWDEFVVHLDEVLATPSLCGGTRSGG